MRMDILAMIIKSGESSSNNSRAGVLVSNTAPLSTSIYSSLGK